MSGSSDWSIAKPTVNRHGKGAVSVLFLYYLPPWSGVRGIEEMSAGRLPKRNVEFKHRARQKF